MIVNSHARNDPFSGDGASTSGWLYHSTSGNVFLNQADWLDW